MTLKEDTVLDMIWRFETLMEKADVKIRRTMINDLDATILQLAALEAVIQLADEWRINATIHLHTNHRTAELRA